MAVRRRRARKGPGAAAKRGAKKYHAFIRKHLRMGHTLKQAQAAWRAHKKTKAAKKPARRRVRKAAPKRRVRRARKAAPRRRVRKAAPKRRARRARRY